MFFEETFSHCADLGSDLLDELEQAKHFPTRDAACRSMRQQLEKLSALTKQHATLLDDSEKKLKDCIELRKLEQQTNEVSGNTKTNMLYACMIVLLHAI